jgi:hypothetical protein
MRLKYVVGRMGGPKVRFSGAINPSEPETILSCVVGRLCGPKARLKCGCGCVCVLWMDWVGPGATQFCDGLKVSLDFDRLD